MSSLKASSILAHFFIFNPRYGSREGEEHKKLLFYWPKEQSQDTQIQNIGFCEAVIKFTESFAVPGGFVHEDTRHTTLATPYHEVATEKQLHIYSHVENEFIAGVAFNVSAAVDANYILYPPTVYRVLVTAYHMFRLFFGTFQSVVSRDDVEGLKHRLEYFFSRYLTNLKLSSMPLMDLYPGVVFMGIDSMNFLKIETLVAQVLEVFPQISKTLFLFRDQMLWYTVPKEDLFILYRYLTGNLLPMSLRAELQPETQRRLSNTQHHGIFVTGPTSIDLGAFSATLSEKTDNRLPTVFLHTNSEETVVRGRQQSSESDLGFEIGGECESTELEAFQLIVYRALNATLALFVPVAHSLDSDFFRNLDTVLGPQLSSLASRIRDLFNSLSPPSYDYQYLYFNPVSLSLKSSFAEPQTFSGAAEGPKTTPALLPRPIVRLSCELRDEAKRSDYLGDVLAKADSDHWVVAKKCNGRELYLFLSQKHANLTDVQEEVKKICSSHFDNLFLSE